MNRKGRFGKTVVVPPGQPRVVRSTEYGFSTWVSEARSPMRGRGPQIGRTGCPLGAARLHQRQHFPQTLTVSKGNAMARQFVYFMQGLSKTYPSRKVLDNVHLSFY